MMIDGMILQAKKLQKSFGVLKKRFTFAAALIESEKV